MAAVLAGCERSSPSSTFQDRQVSDPAGRRSYANDRWKGAWTRSAASSLDRIIAGAPVHGLDPKTFLVTPQAGLGSEQALTSAALAYARALSLGVVDPQKIEPIFTLQRNAPDLETGLQQALQRGDLETWFASLAPGDAEYHMLSAAYLAALEQAKLPPASGPTPADAAQTPADRARQLAANLERRRWLLRTPDPHRIDVNVAGAFLTYFRPGQPALNVRTVVGRKGHETPSIEASFRRVVANPPWRVPPDIAKKEILPKGDDYLARENMTVVDGRVEQAPGPTNSLGLVKFDVQDPYQIYLHDTPAKALFKRPERHRSHGCVRVDGAVDFARQIAAETGKAELFDEALASEETKVVDLGATIPVRMLYHTAYAGPSGIELCKDVYGVDAKLIAALQARRAV